MMCVHWYPYGQKGHKLYDLDNNNTFSSQDIKFNESIFSFCKLLVDPPTHFVVPLPIHKQTCEISPPHSFDTSLATVPNPGSNTDQMNLSNSNECNHAVVESHISPQDNSYAPMIPPHSSQQHSIPCQMNDFECSTITHCHFPLASLRVMSKGIK